jgi:hypothetical protein
MASLLRVKARWSGFQGSPGYSVFHFAGTAGAEPTGSEAAVAAGKVYGFFQAIRTQFPAGVSIQIMPDVEVIESTDGKLVSVLSGGAQSAVTGGASASAGFAAAVGAVVTWRTAGIRNGRRVKGRTFMVPLSSVAFQNDGTLIGDATFVLTQAALALSDQQSSPDLGVYARPSTKGATDGVWHPIVSYSVPDMGAVLRSRRD